MRQSAVMVLTAGTVFIVTDASGRITAISTELRRLNRRDRYRRIAFSGITDIYSTMSPATTTPDSGEIHVFEGPITEAPEPIWPDAPRYAADRPFPVYRFVPGLAPHPVRDPKGHSYRAIEPIPEIISGNNWRQSGPYLYGIDLYHQGYFWEAHDAWEGLWKVADEDSLDANFLQALILNAAAQLKAHTRRAIGVRTHSQAARWRLARIRARGYDNSDMRFFGVEVADLIEQLKRHYTPVWNSKEADVVRLRGPAPRLELKFD